jgi:hypothetical protein
MPFDLSDNSGSNQEVSPQANSGAPTGRASDLLSAKGAPQQSQLPGEGLSFLHERPMTPVDGLLTGALYLALLTNVVCIIYTLWNVWGGTLADPHFTQTYDHADRLRLLGNIHNVDTVILWSSWIAVLCTMFLFYDIAYIGYVLILIAALVNVGVPMLSSYFLTLGKSQLTIATDTAISFLANHAFIALVGGLPLVILDFVRRILEGVSSARVRKNVTFKYGKGAIKTLERRNVFLGSCWNMPYCRQISRGRCPVHAKNQGPCWRKKSGCMCDENVSVIATTPGNWKDTVKNAVSNLDPLEAAKPSSINPLLNFAPTGGRSALTYKEKAARCRDCVIYNAHQEQKYKAVVGVLVAVTAAVIIFFNGPLIEGVSSVYGGLNVALAHFSLASTTAATPAGMSGNLDGPVSWFILIVLTVLILSKLLQLAEYLCFTIKV